MSSFEFVVSAEASRQILELPVDDQWNGFGAFETLAAHPFTTGLLHWVGEDGHTRYLRVVRDWNVTFRIDHADRVVRILSIDRH